MEPRIVCAALQLEDGTIIIGARHFDSFMIQQIKALDVEIHHSTTGQGFIDQFGQYYTREEAYTLADNNGQIIRDKDACNGSLFSENLY